MDPRLPGTLAQQIREQVTWLIAEEGLIPGDELPPARDLARRLGVNFHTVRAAYRSLESDGLVEAVRGRRSRVSRYDPLRLVPPGPSARARVVGIVLPSLSNPFYAELVEGAQESAQTSGTLLIVSSTHDDPVVALRAIARMTASGVDGIVVVSHDIASLLADGAPADDAAPPRLPIVVVDRPGARGHSVEADLEAAGFLAASHLIDDGHRLLGMISIAELPGGGPPSNVIPIEAGMRRAVARAGLALDADRIARVEAWDTASGSAAAARLLEAGSRPTGIVAISDLLAIGAVGGLRRAGVAVPHDVAVVGIDDIPIAAATDPPLTTIALPARAMGARALAVLERAWAGTAGRPHRVVLGVDLVIRESCGPHAS
ncbi:MAG: GntR family transcriptional regulator [Chloroflexi bacterium]|nr:GntR family transcriptional regulator [Chloroflexota bacterium]